MNNVKGSTVFYRIDIRTITTLQYFDKHTIIPRYKGETMKKNRIIFTLILSVSMFINASVCTLAESGNAAANQDNATDSNFTNLIVFARFADESEFVDDQYEGAPVRQIIDNSYNTAIYSVGDFYRNASADKVRMNSVYLYKGNGSVQLPHERGYYASYSADNPNGYKTAKEKAERMYELRMDWSNAVNAAIKAGNSITNYDGSKIYDYKDLDKNGDGEIDSITVIYKNTTQNISVQRSDPLWNYKDYGDYVEIPLENGKQLKSRYYVQLTNTYDHLYQAQDNKPIVSLKAPIHEMGHIFGLLDLYSTSNVSPVYYMSTMSNAISPVPQGISIKEKEALGWTDGHTLQEITQTGDYTLNVSGTNGTQDCVGYKVELPNRNKTLYLEYRNFSADGSKYDTQSKTITDSKGQKVNGMNINSGLICYLANSDIRFPSHMNGKPGNWALEVLGGKASTKSDAAIGLNQTLEIVDGISVCVTAMDKGTLTFHIEGNFAQHQHSGGVASCRAKAVCEVCGKEYGEFDSTRHLHTERRGVKEATQQEYGFTGDLYCKDCDTLLEAGQVIDKLPATPQPVEPTPEEKPEIKPETTTPPVMLEGEQSVVIKNAEEDAVAEFRSSAPLETFLRVEVDDVVLTQGRDYTVRSGSTIVTLSPTFIMSLSEGTHHIAVVSTGGTASAGFSVIAKTSSEGSGTPVQKPSVNENQSGVITDQITGSLDGTEADGTMGSVKQVGDQHTSAKSPQCGEERGVIQWIVSILKKLQLLVFA